MYVSSDAYLGNILSKTQHEIQHATMPSKLTPDMAGIANCTVFKTRETNFSGKLLGLKTKKILCRDIMERKIILARWTIGCLNGSVAWIIFLQPLRHCKGACIKYQGGEVLWYTPERFNYQGCLSQHDTMVLCCWGKSTRYWRSP